MTWKLLVIGLVASVLLVGCGSSDTPDISGKDVPVTAAQGAPGAKAAGPTPGVAGAGGTAGGSKAKSTTQ